VRTIFALFDGYAEARVAVEELRNQGFRVDAMNAIILADVGRGAMDVNASEALGGRTLHGLDRMLATEHPVHLPPVGAVLAAGELANFIVASAGSPDAEAGLVPALVDFGIPQDTAEAYQRGLIDGGLLFWIRAEDERASEVRGIVQQRHASRVVAYP
jgi:hypothetical protein